jgi:hypothetical protein
MPIALILCAYKSKIGMVVSLMKGTHIRLAVVLLCLVMIGFSSTALAAPSLQWHSDYVYYDSNGLLVVEGYFFNAGTNTVTWVNWLELEVYFKGRYTQWWLQAKVTYENLNVYLYPGDTARWTFRITNVDFTYFDYWNVTGNVNYHYL